MKNFFAFSIDSFPQLLGVLAFNRDTQRDIQFHSINVLFSLDKVQYIF